MTAIEQIRAELEAATPGPWSTEREDDVEMFGDPVHLIGDGEPGSEDAYLFTTDANATLIAHAPTHLAALLDVALAAQAVVARHPDSPVGEHPAVDMLRPALERLEAL